MLRRALSLAFVCTALLAGGCGTSSSTESAGATERASVADPINPAKSVSPTPESDPTRLVLAAVEATGRTTARTAHRTELGTGADATYVISGGGAHDFVHHRGTTDVEPASAARFDEVFADGKVYLRGTAGSGTRGWSVVDRDDLEAQHILRSPANDPEYTLRQAAMGTDFRAAGEEKTGSTPTTHYRGRLPFEALTLEMSEESLTTAKTLRQMVGGEIPVPVDVWVDGHGRATRIRMSLRIEGAATSVSTLTLTDLGRPVEVTVPGTATEAEAGGMGILG
ncbi:hypothetical protein [Streptomyces sp. AM 2-1-1]|uniref:hypothetical protein n=1 Tax=Streptomyces sp. AM 2-1-1 TaxID=3028709 RepID=UPI0023BA189D|nr:hypothetical protein [Streptomyces sp. AM 2-1-1]WEH41000.1 hypothetical protein PZB77_16665 [Streptomyces sp. AM 2-1-1]